MEIAQLQSTYPIFSYDSYAYEVKDGLIEFSFQYSCGDKKFVTIDTLSGVTQEMVSLMESDELNEYIFQLGLAEIPTYWKAFLSPVIQIHCGTLTDTQEKFWKKLFYHGLGEFFYQNTIVPFEPAFIVNETTGAKTYASKLTSKSGENELPAILIPVGGGKDSIVSLELLAQAGYPIYTFSGLKGSSSSVIDLFGKNHPRVGDIIFSRTLDPQLLELNRIGHPNGHTPFSSVLAFFTVLTARLYQIPSIAISNESSASEPTGTWQGIDINHQYSKSFEFESDFQTYVKDLFSESAPYYFSFLRPLQELQIMNIFIRSPQYFSVFHSCNVGQKTNTWCGNCGKCAFVLLLLSAFVDDETITSIFRQDILAGKNLTPYIDELIGLSEFKPFECVGTRSESQAALYLAITRREGKTLPALLIHYDAWVEERKNELRASAEKLLHSFDTNNNVPVEYTDIIKKNI